MHAKLSEQAQLAKPSDAVWVSMEDGDNKAFWNP